MPIITTTAITDFVVKNLGSYLFKKSMDKGLEATDKTLRASMYNTMMSTLEEYEQKYPLLLLEESPERILIADDTFYFMFGVGTNKVISTEFYIKVVEGKSAEAGAEFIKSGYRGITFEPENLNMSYEKKKW